MSIRIGVERFSGNVRRGGTLSMRSKRESSQPSQNILGAGKLVVIGGGAKGALKIFDELTKLIGKGPVGIATIMRGYFRIVPAGRDHYRNVCWSLCYERNNDRFWWAGLFASQKVDPKKPCACTT